MRGWRRDRRPRSHSSTCSARSSNSRGIATPIAFAAFRLITSSNLAKDALRIERIGVVAELTSKQRGRVFSYARYVAVLNEGTRM